MGAIRASFAQFVAVARGEMRLTFAGAPALGWQVLISLAWGLTAIVLGCVIGLMAVVLPPMSVFGVVGLAALVLLWVMPDLNTEPYKLIRRMFFVALVVDLCLPTYYTIQIASLPWISARRVATFPLIVLFAVTYASSRDAREHIARVVSRNRLLALCAFGFPVMAFVSILTSKNPTASLNGVSDVLIEWYFPFVAFLYVIS